MLKVTVKSQRDKLDFIYCFMGSGPTGCATFAHIHQNKKKELPRRGRLLTSSHLELLASLPHKNTPVNSSLHTPELPGARAVVATGGQTIQLKSLAT